MNGNRKERKIKNIHRQKSDVARKVDTMKYCGVIKLKEDPLTIQKKLRNEWQ
jgi:predicted transcriptional regulator